MYLFENVTKNNLLHEANRGLYFLFWDKKRQTFFSMVFENKSLENNCMKSQVLVNVTVDVCYVKEQDNSEMDMMVYISDTFNFSLIRCQ